MEVGASFTCLDQRYATLCAMARNLATRRFAPTPEKLKDKFEDSDKDVEGNTPEDRDEWSATQGKAVSLKRDDAKLAG